MWGRVSGTYRIYRGLFGGDSYAHIKFIFSTKGKGMTWVMDVRMESDANLKVSHDMEEKQGGRYHKTLYK